MNNPIDDIYILEINSFQQDNEILVDPPLKFSLTQLQNGNFVLSSSFDYHRLKTVLSNWQKTHSTIEDFEIRYNRFLESNKKIHLNMIDNKDFWEVCPSDINSTMVLDSFAVESKIDEDFTTILDVQGIQKYLDGNRIFIGCLNGSLQEYSMVENKIIHKFGETLNDGIYSMSKTFDNKSLFVCDWDGGFREFDISIHRQVKTFEAQNVKCCAITNDNKFIFTATKEPNCNLTKWKIQTKQSINIIRFYYTWKGNVNKTVASQNCSYDRRYQFIGYWDGWLGIFDIKYHKTIKNIQALSFHIKSVAFTQGHQSAYISDIGGNVKMINWKQNTNSKHDFDFTQNSIKVGNYNTNETCLTKDDKNLFVGSGNHVRVFNTETRKVTKQFKLNDNVHGLMLINSGKNVIIAQRNGDLSIIDLKTFEISRIHKNVTDGKRLTKILVI